MPNQGDSQTAVIRFFFFNKIKLFVHWYLKFQHKDLYIHAHAPRQLSRKYSELPQDLTPKQRSRPRICSGSCLNQILLLLYSSQRTDYYAGMSIFLHSFSTFCGRGEVEPVKWMQEPTPLLDNMNLSERGSVSLPCNGRVWLISDWPWTVSLNRKICFSTHSCRQGGYASLNPSAFLCGCWSVNFGHVTLLWKWCGDDGRMSLASLQVTFVSRLAVQGPGCVCKALRPPLQCSPVANRDDRSSLNSKYNLPDCWGNPSRRPLLDPGPSH